MSWKIRFYSGLNQGAQVPLMPGRVVIGSDPLQADLVLVDAGIAAIHLVLDVDAQGVKLMKWDESISPTQDDEVCEGGHFLRPLARQSCGPLIWAFCGQDIPLPDQLLAAVKPPERCSTSQVSRWGGRLLAGFTLALLATLIGLLSDSWSGAQETVASERPLKGLQSYLRDSQLTNVEIEEQADGNLLIVGFLDDNRGRLALQRYLDQSPLSYRLEVHSMEDIRQRVDFILQKLGYGTVRSTNGEKAGWIRLSGVLATEDERWSRIDALLREDVPGLQGIENRVHMAGSHVKRLNQLLAESRLGALLSARDLGDRIELRGALDESQTNAFYQLQRDFQQEFGPRPSLELVRNNHSHNAARLDFAVRGVSMGKVPYVILSDNQKYPVGAVTPQGVRVMAIESHAIVVLKGRQQHIVNLKGATQ